MSAGFSPTSPNNYYTDVHKLKLGPQQHTSAKTPIRLIDFYLLNQLKTFLVILDL